MCCKAPWIISFCSNVEVCGNAFILLNREVCGFILAMYEQIKQIGDQSYTTAVSEGPSSAYSEFFALLNSISSFLTCEHRNFNNTVFYIIRHVHEENGIASWLQLEIWKDIFRAWGVGRGCIGSEGYFLNWPHWVQAPLSRRLGHVALQLRKMNA